MPLTRRTAIYIGLAIAAASTVIIASLVAFGAQADGWFHAARYTARLGFCLFLIPFAAPALLPRFGDTAIRDTFLAFATAHAIHLAALITYRLHTGEPPTIDAILGGGLAYGALFLLASILLAGRPLPRYFPHALHYILLIFALTYAGRLGADDTRLLGILGVCTAMAALVVRHALPRLIRQRLQQ